MIRLITIGIIVLSSSLGFAQSRFFTFVEGWVNNISVEYDGDYQVLGLESLGQLPGEHGLIINTLDEAGMTITQLSWVIDTVHSTSSRGTSSAAIRLNDSTLMMAGVIAYENGETEGTLYKYDLLNDEISLLEHYGGFTNVQFYSLEALSDTSVLVAATTSNPMTSIDARVYCIHLDGSVLWTQDISWGNQYQRTKPVEVITLSNGHIASLFWEHEVPGGSFDDRWRARLSVLDETGEILWTRYPGDHENYRIRPGGLVEQDGDILVAFSDPHFYDEYGEWQAYVTNSVRLERYDLDGEIVAEGSVFEGLEEIPAARYARQIIPTSDGNYLIAGYHRSKHAYLAKITPDYETIWFERYIPHEWGDETGIDYQELQILNVIETSDGGFLCTGIYFSDPGSILYPYGIQTAIALKVDEYGCLVENCSVGLEDLGSSTQLGALQVYPNPARDVLRVKLPSRLGSMSAMGAGGERWQLLQIIDLTGRVVLEISNTSTALSAGDEVAIELSSLGSGLYAIILSNGDGRQSSGKFLKE